MPKINVKVEMPRHSPDKFIKLNKRIIKKHEELDEDSPLKELDMARVKSQTMQAETIRDEAAKLHAQAESLNQKALLLLGIGKGQNSYTEGTVYFEDILVRNRLLQVYKNAEETLSMFGFKVVIRKSKMPKRKKKEPNDRTQ